jgi:thiamine monophosphate kinase
VAEPGELAVIGRVEAGDGVLVLRGGEPVELAGWQHFTRG